MFRLFLTVSLMLFIFSSPAWADFYKWEDEEGNIHITDYLPPSKSARKLKVHRTESNADRSAPSVPQRRAASTRTPDRPEKEQEVDLYTARWCSACKSAKNFFTSRNIRFTEYDVEADPEAAERMKRLTPARGVPFAVVNGRSIIGYAPAEYEAALRDNR
ncbi:MAG: glutaredoxin family protein [Deltaproteobacteria bacterium]|nr:glutaredoxin family protein [Deltaproteobacteria bacterium]